MTLFDKAWEVVKEESDEPEWPEGPREDENYLDFRNRVMSELTEQGYWGDMGLPHDWDEEGAIAEHWHMSDTCECNNEDDALEGLSEEETNEMAFSAGGHPRRLKWPKGSGYVDDGNYYTRCGHCGVGSLLNMKTGEWQ